METAKAAESTFAVPLLESVRERGFRAGVAVLDMGYDRTPVYEGFGARDCHPIIPLRETPAVKAGKHKPPVYEHGDGTFAGADAKRQAAKWHCPTGECSPAQPVDHRQPAPHPDPARGAAVEEALPAAWRGRAGERPTQERVGAAATGSSA